jgi:glyoxylase-like metal-dependent hydrolase (beta-lactamase superfamily II)
MHEMKRFELADHLIRYQFPPGAAGKHYGFNIYAMLNGAEAMLIDSGYERHAGAVLADLQSRGVSVTGVIASHFHEDHIMGLRVLPGARVLGSERFSETLAQHPPDGGPEQFTPDRLLRDGSSMTFGRFSLRFLSTPGHSPCSLCTCIDQDFIHVADNFLASNEGEPILPFAKATDFPDHILSLKRIRRMSHLKLLPGHGAAVDGREVVEREVDRRLHYLETVADGPATPTLQDVADGCAAGFLHTEWHDHNIGIV